MKQILFILFTFLTSCLCAQRIAKRKGDVKILIQKNALGKDSIIHHGIYLEYYFNKHGLVLEEIIHGTVKDNDLKNIGEINQYYYNDSLLILSKSFNRKHPSWEYNEEYVEYKYEKSELFCEKVFDYDGECIDSTLYFYKPNLTIEANYFDNDTTIKYIYKDSLTEVFSMNKLAYRYEYQLKDSCMEGNLNKYDEDGIGSNLIYQIDCYDSHKRLIYRNVNSRFYYFEYTENGILKKISENVFPDSKKRNYKNWYYIEVKKLPKYITSNSIKNINKKLIKKVSSRFDGIIDLED